MENSDDVSEEEEECCGGEQQQEKQLKIWSLMLECLKRLDLVHVNKCLVNERFELNKLEISNNANSNFSRNSSRRPSLLEMRGSIASVECVSLATSVCGGGEKLLKNWHVEYTSGGIASSDSDELTSTCDFLNAYVNMSLLESLLDLIDAKLKLFHDDFSATTKKSSTIKISIHHRNNYISLIDDISSSPGPYTLTLGARSIRFDSAPSPLHFGASDNYTKPHHHHHHHRRSTSDLKLCVHDFIVFKSSSKSSPENNTNSLFASVGGGGGIVDVFERINERKRVSSSDTFTHVWGNLVNVNEMRLSYRAGKSVKLLVDRVFVEYSPPSAWIILDRFVQRLERIRSRFNNNRSNYDYEDLKMKSLSSSSSRYFLLNVQLNHASVYFLFEKSYFVYACVNRFRLLTKRLSTGKIPTNGNNNGRKEVFHLKVEQANCSQYRLDELLENR